MGGFFLFLVCEYLISNNCHLSTTWHNTAQPFWPWKIDMQIFSIAYFWACATSIASLFDMEWQDALKLHSWGGGKSRRDVKSSQKWSFSCLIKRAVWQMVNCACLLPRRPNMEKVISMLFLLQQRYLSDTTFWVHNWDRLTQKNGQFAGSTCLYIL